MKLVTVQVFNNDLGTSLEDLQVFPQDVADEGGRSRLKGVLSHCAYVLPFHAELVKRYPFQ